MRCLKWSWLFLVAACVKLGPSDSATPEAGTDSSDGNWPLACESWGEPVAVGRVEDPSLEEISGLVVSFVNPGVLWVMEDSGARPELVALNTSGVRLGTVNLKGATNTDWEDLASGPCGDKTCLWVGEFGDNAWARDEVAILRIVEPDITGLNNFTMEIEPEVQPYVYPEGAQDVEALVVNPDGVPMVLTKRLDGSSRLYRVPFQGKGRATAELVSTLATGPVEGLPTAVTAADSWPDGSRILVRCYLRTFELLLGESSADEASNAPTAEVLTALEGQGEAIAYDVLNQAIWHVSEGVNPDLYRIGCASGGTE